MSNFDFVVINCKACGKLIWSGNSSGGFSTKLDTGRLNILEEIVKKVSNIRTYEAHRTAVSFEATLRIGARVIGTEYKPERVILAEHECSTLNKNVAQIGNVLPDYWGRDVNPKLEPEEILF